MILDLYTELRTNATFANRISDLCGQLDKLHRAWGTNAQYMKETGQVLRSIYKASDFNSGLLFPYMFPNAFRGRPLSLMQRPFAFTMTALNPNGETTIRGSRQGGKSIAIGADSITVSQLVAPHSILYVVPRSENLRTFQNKLKALERGMRYVEPPNPNFRKNLGFKEFMNGSVMDLQYVNESPDNIRGKSVDRLILDESQHFDANMLPEIRETQTASDCPSSVYAGTSTTLDTFLEAKYLASSQGTFVVRDGTGHGWIDCGDGDKLLELIKPRGPTCPKTGRILDMTDVRLVHRYMERAKDQKIGIHVPKIIVPDLVRDEIQWGKIYRTFEEYSALGQLKKFLQEVLGIPTEEGASELTQQDLERMCCLAESPERLQQNAHKGGFYKFVIAGIDWGGSDYNPSDGTKLSFTFLAIMGVTVEGHMDILHMDHYAGMDYDRIIHEIGETCAKYRVRYIASDFGGGAQYNLMLRRHPKVNPSGHFIIQYGGNNLQMFNRAHSALSNHFMAHKTESITELIGAIRAVPYPRIRCYKGVEQPYPTLLQDFLNMRRVIEETDSGASKFRYRRHGSKPDDGLHAVNFAFMMARVIRGESIVDDPLLRQEIYEVLRDSQNTGRGGMVISG